MTQNQGRRGPQYQAPPPSPQWEEIQKELEQQLEQFGAALSGALDNGFAGRGQQLGDHAWAVGRSVLGAIGYGLAQAGRAVDQAVAGQKPRAAWQDVWEPARRAARKLFADGLAMAIVGGVVGGSLFIGGAVTLALGLTEAVGEGLAALAVTGGALLFAAALLGWLAVCGFERMGAARQIRACVAAAEAAQAQQGIPLQLLAEMLQQPPRALRQRLAKLIRKGWLPAWLDEARGWLYFSGEHYRAARMAAAQGAAPDAGQTAPGSAAQPGAGQEQAPPEGAVSAGAIRRFAQLLGQEKALVADEAVAGELQQMQATVGEIAAWVEAHPQSLGKVRRMAEYYIPTTLKLLHTYNEVQGQSGENAAHIRTEVAGILHTLNQAFAALYDQLLADTALDVSAEVAALEGMLHTDGLTGGML